MFPLTLLTGFVFVLTFKQAIFFFTFAITLKSEVCWVNTKNFTRDLVSAVSIIQSLMCWCPLHCLCHGHTVCHIHLCSEVYRPGCLATVPHLSDSQETPEVWQMPFCENFLMKVTALPGNGPSSSWATSLIFSRMMEPCDIMEHIIVCCLWNSWKEMRVTKFERKISRIFVEKNWHLSTGRTGPWKFIFTELSSFAILMLARKSSATWFNSNGEYWPLSLFITSRPPITIT